MLASATIYLRRVLSRTERGAITLLGLFAMGPIACCGDIAGFKDLLGLSGTARVSYFTKDNTFVNDPGVQCDSLWITARPSDIAGTKTYFDANLQGQLVTGNSKIRGDLREGYAERAFGDVDLKMGRQIIVWGRADKINPTDVWSIRNYRLLATDDDDQRIGATALKATWNVGNDRLVAVWQPEFRTPVLPIPPPRAGAGLTSVIAARKTAQLGVKYDHSGAGLDWSVSYSHAINRTPDLTLLSGELNHDDQGGPRLGLAYKFADLVGADVAFPVGKFGFRGEVAHVHARNSHGLDPLGQNDCLFAVAGMDRTWGGRLNVNVQYLFRYMFDYRDPSSMSGPFLRGLATQARLIDNQLAATMEGASFRIDYKARNETLEMEISGAMWFKRNDSFSMLKISYAFTDRIKGIVGANLWSGPLDSFFGRLRTTSAAFVELRFGL